MVQALSQIAVRYANYENLGMTQFPDASLLLPETDLIYLLALVRNK